MLKLSNLETIGRPVYNFHNLHSVDFDGVDDFIQLGEPISYTQHTISTWVKVSDSDASKTIIDARDANDDGIRIFLTSAEVVTYQLNTSDITSGSAISVDEWHHIVGTYDGTTQKLYIDGSLADSTTTSQTISTTTNAKIGARNFSDRANEFLGKIDELAIFDRALTADEVTAIFRIKYGANLVQNGNFDELGSELLTQPLNLSSNFQNNGGGIIVDNDTFTTAGGSFDGITSPSSFLVTGKTYKLIIAGNTTSSGFTIGNQVLSGNEYATGFGTHYFVASGDRLWIRQQTAGTTNITSFSIKQVDPNDRWSFSTGSGWSYSDSVATNDGSGGRIFPTSNSWTNGVVIKFQIIVSGRTTGHIRVQNPAVSTYYKNNINTNGFHEFTFTTVDANGFVIEAVSGFDGSIDNIVVQQQKYVATNLKLKSALFNPFTGSTLNLKNYYRFGDGILDFFMSQTGSDTTTLTDGIICDMVEPSLGTEMVINGNFATDTNWSTGSGWTIDTANNRAVRDNQQTGNSQISQTIAIEQDKIYRVEYTREYLSGTGQTNVFSDFVTDGSSTTRGRFVNTETGKQFTIVIYFQPQYTGNFPLQVYGIGTFSGIITNVSMKEVNGVAGLMTNMSEADITNDVPG